MAARSVSQAKVWDLFVRVAHWAVALAFFVAYLTEDEALMVHVWAGYTVGSLVLLRVLWGFIGPRHARFSDFVCGPRKVIDYMFHLVRLRAPRYLGHSPAGGAMIIALLLCLAATVATGLLTYADEKGSGPLAPLFAQSEPSPLVAIAGQSMKEGGEGIESERGKRESAFKDVHEFFANITLVLVILHTLGVILASFAHRENLARAMVTGHKRTT